MSTRKKHTDSLGFTRVAAVVPPLLVAHPQHNAQEILKWAKKADRAGASLIVFPELSITGYTAADLFQQRVLLNAARAGIDTIVQESKKIRGMLFVGAPVSVEGKLYNAAYAIHRGNILGIVPKTYVPGYKEFYEERWFASGRDMRCKEIQYAGASVPIGVDLLFRLGNNPDAIVGIEICEDLWVPIPPSSFYALRGATIIANLSASNELVSKADYRKQLISQHSARCMSGYVYTSCGVHESTTDLVFGGHALIAENGAILKESGRFSRSGEMIISDIDVEHLIVDRERTTSFNESAQDIHGHEPRIIEAPVSRAPFYKPERTIDPHPFVPSQSGERDKRSEEIFSIQSAGLAKRLEYSGVRKLVLGLSGGLDSTLALLVAVKTYQMLNWPLTDIITFSLPGFGTTKRTKSNAAQLASALGVSYEECDIAAGASLHLKELRHEGAEDITYENVQARYRTMLLMNKANQVGALMLGTSDLSEIALGWTTFSGDHLSHYNVNAGVPKTLVRYLVYWIRELKEFSRARDVLRDILATPISPELTRAKKGKIAQETEKIIGPYELHDFFLYHFLRWGSRPRKILFLALKAFGGKYTMKEIKRWLGVFIERFFKNQWKRSVMPDGPKVGSIALSPRGDWRMPSDAAFHAWISSIS